jgi:hypothetical protein
MLGKPQPPQSSHRRLNRKRPEGNSAARPAVAVYVDSLCLLPFCVF